MIWYSVKLKKSYFCQFFKRSYINYSDNIVFKYAIKIYIDPLNQRNLVRNDNNGKIGVYSWVNKVNGKFYIGSGNSLYIRISDYYQNWYILSRSSLYIVKAFVKYGMKNFSLVILEYSDSDNLILCEQKWINFLRPQYNIRFKTINTISYKHTVKNTKKNSKFSIIRKHTENIKHIESNFCKGESNYFYPKKYSKESLNLLNTVVKKIKKSPVSGLEVEIIDLKTNITTVFASIRKAAEAIGSDIKTILRREKSQIKKGLITPYRKRYLIIIKR